MTFPNPLHIEVTEEDMRLGIRKSASSCPIALSLKRALPKETEIEVDEFYITMWNDETKATYIPTPNVTAFIKQFDRGELNNDIRLVVDLPREWEGSANEEDD